MLMKTNTLPSIPDQRDIVYVPTKQPGQLPFRVMLTHLVTRTEDQGAFGTCVAHGLTSNCESLARLNSVELQLARWPVYHEGRRISGLGPDTEGMIPRDALKALYKFGSVPEEQWPYTADGTPRYLSAENLEVAENYRIKRYEAVIKPGDEREYSDRIHAIKSALAEGLPVGWASVVTQSLRTLTGPWHAHRYVLDVDGALDNPIIGGHYWNIYGYDDLLQLFWCQNSWGTSWGDAGFFGVPYNIVHELFAEAWIVRNFADHKIPEPPGIKLEAGTRLRCTARIVPPAELVGSTKNIWVGAKMPTGEWYLKTSPTQDVWAPLPADIPPTASNVVLQENTIVDLVHWMELAPYRGAQLFLAYGDSPANWELSHVWTVPEWY